MNDLPVLISRCLTHGVEILPYAQKTVLNEYERRKIPDAILNKMSKGSLEKYVKALYLGAQEGAGDWTKGHEMLCELGFVRTKREDGHRTFIGLVYQPQPEESPPTIAVTTN